LLEFAERWSHETHIVHNVDYISSVPFAAISPLPVLSQPTTAVRTILYVRKCYRGQRLAGVVRPTPVARWSACRAERAPPNLKRISDTLEND
jgi:hypothetical protein